MLLSKQCAGLENGMEEPPIERLYQQNQILTVMSLIWRDARGSSSSSTPLSHEI